MRTTIRKMPTSAITGRRVTAAYAKAHPKTTVVLSVKVPAKRKKP